MNKQKRLSPFEQLLRAIEREIYDLVLELQYPGTEINWDFVVGYRTALNVLLEKAYSIYNRRTPSEFISMDERSQDTTLKLLELLRRGS